MGLKEMLDVDDELNLYLVVNSLKPSTMIGLSSLSPRLTSRVTKEEKLDGKVKYVTLRVNPDVVDDLKSLLDELGVAYKHWKQENVSEAWESGTKIMHQTCHGLMFYVGSNQPDLERLLLAKSNEDIGLALGFPKEAVESFQKVIDGEKRDGSYFTVSLARAKQAGLELPTWLAYICFVPENLDLVNGNISPSSKIIGEKYQAFVRANNPELAQRAEQHFLERKLPDKWEKTPSGGYSCSYILQPSPNR